MVKCLNVVLVPRMWLDSWNMLHYEKHDLSPPPPVISSLSSLKWMVISLNWVTGSGQGFLRKKTTFGSESTWFESLNYFLFKKCFTLKMFTLNKLLYERNKTKMIFPFTVREWNRKLYGARTQYIHRLRQMTTIMLSHIKNI